MNEKTFFAEYNKLVKNELSLKYVTNVDTGLHILPVNARKGDKLKCYRCEERAEKRESIYNLHFCKHTLNDKNCNYYSNKMEKLNLSTASQRRKDEARTEIHKKAIELLCHHLKNGNEIIIYTKCNESEKYPDICKYKKITNEIKLEEGDIVKSEYGFKLNPDDEYNKYADIAILNKNNEMKKIIEICNTHATDAKDRPTNITWFELDAFDTIEKIIGGNDSFECIKPWTCKSCCDERTRQQIQDDKEKREMEELRIKYAKENEERRLVSEEKEKKEKEEREATNYLQRQEEEKIRAKEREERLAKQEREKEEKKAEERERERKRLAKKEQERLEEEEQEKQYAKSAPALYKYKLAKQEMLSKRYWKEGMWHIRV